MKTQKNQNLTIFFSETLDLEEAHQQAVDWAEENANWISDVVIHTTMTPLGPQSRIINKAAAETSAAFSFKEDFKYEHL